ncbi:TraX family protein [Leptotrichia sp. oral taxon 879]|uniref:TraX family protein n=1 Tax=Leptotrichia sp. oral taxon 879 TaxID=1227267 RepID=UPI0003F52D5F|nr:TraX family protein [Leptotrichia sp. oral taxon 879]
MSLFILKIIGIIAMFVDHYHYIIGGNVILNIVGRIAFPIFAFTLSEGYVHTRNLKKYLYRLLIFAIGIQIPSIIFGHKYPINIFFTLFLGLLTIYILNFKKKYIKNQIFLWIIKIILMSFILFISQWLEMDYGAYGILLIVNFNISRNSKFCILMNFLILNTFNLLFPDIFKLTKTQFFSIVSLIFIFMYNGKKGRSMKYFFYLFYPIHFLILEGIRNIR